MPEPARPFTIDIDHVILGVTDLAYGTACFAALTGVTPAFGGEHPGRGTRNALVGLGPTLYLEILGAADPRPAALDPKVRYAELTLAGWALATSSIEDVVGRLRTAGLHADDPVPGSRHAPDGTRLQWRTAVASGPGLEMAPFFIEWSADTVHPSAGAPAGCRLRSLEVETVDATPLQTCFAAVGFQPVLRTGRSDTMRLVMDSPRGLVTFSSAAEE
jgi:hypothetical protein